LEGWDLQPIDSCFDQATESSKSLKKILFYLGEYLLIVNFEERLQHSSSMASDSQIQVSVRARSALPTDGASESVVDVNEPEGQVDETTFGNRGILANQYSTIAQSFSPFLA
jgi:hypothetical protein